MSIADTPRSAPAPAPAPCCAAAASPLCAGIAEVGPQHLVEVEVFQIGGDALVEHLHHLVGRDAVGEHPGDERAGAGADVDVEVVDGAVDGEQVEGAQGADLIDAAGEAAAAEDEARLRGPFAPRALRRGWELDVHNFAHKHGLSQVDETEPCVVCRICALLLLPGVAGATAPGQICQAMKARLVRGGGQASGLLAGGRLGDRAGRLRAGGGDPAPPRLEHEARSRPRPRWLGSGWIPASRPGCSATAG